MKNVKKNIFTYIVVLLVVIASSFMIPLNANEAYAQNKDRCAVWDPVVEDCLTIIIANCFCEIVVE